MTDLSPDGRLARSERSRRAAAKAMLALVQETGAEPRAEDVAERAGLSRRTVFRLFRDLESLHLAATELQRAEVMRLFPLPQPADESLATTVRRVLAHRTAVFEHVLPLRALAERLRHQHAFVAASIDEALVARRMHLREMFGAHLAEGDRHWQSLELLTGWQAYHCLRTNQSCTPAEALEVLSDALLRVFNVD